MNTSRKIMKTRVLWVCQRFMNVEAKDRKKPQWFKPVGYQTNIAVYNPITKCKVPLTLRNKNFLSWYMCGPTVYDSTHIGHAATYMKADIISRILSNYFNINVLSVMCITDIDDKIIQRSKAKNQTFDELARHYENEFLTDMDSLNIKRPYLCCKVSKYVPQIIQFVEKIIAADYAYVTKDGSVYFDTGKYDKYGKLSTPFPESPHAEKRSTLDFALWKGAKEGEPYWECPWGRGRPGWHIECSTIASAVFGSSIDIHSGGIDLAFPHHENEEAQSCCYHNVDQWVNHWMHFGHLNLKGDVKMSKSLNNTISIQEYLKKYTSNQWRMLCLMSHYRNGIEFTDVVLNNAISILNKIENFLSDCENYITGHSNLDTKDEVFLLQCLDTTKDKITSVLADDFNTPRAVQAVVNLIDHGNKMFQNRKDKISGSRNVVAVAAVSQYISNLLSTFGFSHVKSMNDNKIENVMEHFMKFRSIVRNAALDKDIKADVLLNACDEIRFNLSTCGIIVKDIKKVSTWSVNKF
ncbi:hypothetical protein KM043_009998 [Ampulex compressa]|nr:hypothetical protein KM043_009998 [Ampulex compressa]